MPRKPKVLSPLAILRGAAGLTQAELAERLGIAAGTLQNIELGRHRPSAEIVRKIQQVFGCAVLEHGDGRLEVAALTVRGKPYTSEAFQSWSRWNTDRGLELGEVAALVGAAAAASLAGALSKEERKDAVERLAQAVRGLLKATPERREAIEAAVTEAVAPWLDSEGKPWDDVHFLLSVALTIPKSERTWVSNRKKSVVRELQDAVDSALGKRLFTQAPVEPVASPVASRAPARQKKTR